MRQSDLYHLIQTHLPGRGGSSVLQPVLRLSLIHSVLIGAMSLLLLPGCTHLVGAMTAVGAKDKKVKAQYYLTEGPILILVDDTNHLIDWPAAPQKLMDELSQQLLRHKAAVKVVPRETLENLKLGVADFDKKSAREIGELAGADQIIWIETQNFLATDEVDESSEAALWTVTVKVLNAKEKKDRAAVRLWPTGAAGAPLNVRMTAATALRLKTRDAVSEGLANMLAIDITKLFCDHKESDFET